MVNRLLRVAALALGSLTASCATPQISEGDIAPVTVGILAINDFHGSLEPPKQSTLVIDENGEIIGLPSGGAAYLATALDTLREGYEHHLTVSAGDLFGASPLASSLFLDEPTIAVMNRIGLDFNAVGNHEFDLGTRELLRKQAGGCEQFQAREPCAIEPFTGADFAFLAANVLRADGTTLFPGTALRTFGEGAGAVSVGLIGMTLRETPSLVPAEGISDVTFADEADIANALVTQLEAQGADAIVLLIHQGGRTTNEPDPQGCEGLSAEIRPILDRLDPRVDVVLSGHTHWAYVCNYAQYNPDKPFLLTSAGLWGKLVTDVTLTIDPVSGRVVERSARNVPVQSVAYEGNRGIVEVKPGYRQFAARADIADYVARYVEAASSYANRKTGLLAAPVLKTTGTEIATGGALGRLIADAHLAATRDAGAQIAFTNPFGLRASLVPADDGSVTFADLYAAQPFNNQLVTLDLTGAQIKAALEQGFDTIGPEQVLSGSQGFSFTYDRSRPVGDRIVAMSLNGEAIAPAQTYRVTLNQFLANGGDTFDAFVAGTNRAIGVYDIDALEAWLNREPARVPPAEQRAIDARPDLNPLLGQSSGQ